MFELKIIITNLSLSHFIFPPGLRMMMRLQKFGRYSNTRDAVVASSICMMIVEQFKREKYPGWCKVMYKTLIAAVIIPTPLLRVWYRCTY